MLKFIAPEERMDIFKTLYLSFQKYKVKFESEHDIYLGPVNKLIESPSKEIILLPKSYQDYLSRFSIISEKNRFLVCASENKIIDQRSERYATLDIAYTSLHCNLYDMHIMVSHLSKYFTWQKQTDREDKTGKLFEISGSGILVQKLNQDYFIPYKDILFFEAFDDLCWVNFINNGDIQKTTVSYTLSNLEAIASGSVFFRSHRKHLINLLHIKDFGSYPQNDLTFKKFPQILLPLSRRKKLDLQLKYKEIRHLLMHI
jgi:hypothetical protein